MEMGSEWAQSSSVGDDVREGGNGGGKGGGPSNEIQHAVMREAEYVVGNRVSGSGEIFYGAMLQLARLHKTKLKGPLDSTLTLPFHLI